MCRMTLETRKRSITKAEPRIKWWKLKKKGYCEEFREEIRRALGGEEEVPDDWTTTANIVRDTARKVRYRGKKTRRLGGGMRKCKKAYGRRDWRRRGGIYRAEFYLSTSPLVRSLVKIAAD